ncbi:MAG: alpha-L-arabinofuranosidase, partial [Bacteroidales bacterium]|nr:alpha-L-arabinofuranosidase [Bacteroidales bacterium]
KKNSFETALAEAAFLTGVERNADVVRLATYAPLLAHVDAWQWNPDLIWFDNLQLARSVNYYVQQLYSLYKGTDVLSFTQNGLSIAGDDDLYASAVLDKTNSQIIIKLANVSENNCRIKINVKNLPKKQQIASKIQAILLAGDLKTVNTLDNSNAIIPQHYDIDIQGNDLIFEIKNKSFNVYKLKIENQ